MPAHILAKLTTYSNDNGAEMTWCVQPDPIEEDYGGDPLCQRLPSGYRPRRYQEDYAEGSLERAERKACQEIRKRLIEHRLNHMVTLTTRENVEDYDKALEMAQTFVKLVRVHLPEWKYVMVPERQERGAWHWHLAAHGWQKLEVLRGAWAKVCGGIKAGNVDVQGPGRKGRMATTYRWNPCRLAGYLLKYIKKEMADRPTAMKGRHRYTSGHGMRTWDETFNAFPVDTSLADLLIWFTGTGNNPGGISRLWEDKEKGIGWVT